MSENSNQSSSGGVVAAPVSFEGFGTFGGVFTPSILTILGVIMYLRFGWVIANAGLVGTMLIVTLSTVITLLTALSIAEIATDQDVRTGGAYYMISRALGLESGGAVGIPLFVAQALSVALYTVGFAESLTRTFPALDQRWVGVVTTVLIAGVALKSAQIAIKSQYFIMAAIVVSLISLAFGEPVSGPMVDTVPDAAPFWVVFAVFFPAVTGIMAGVNMSGDLKDPSKSIPIGTLMAVLVGYVIYMAIPLFLIRSADAQTLASDPLIMRKIAFWGDAILLGVWGATLSSAMGSMLGAPRVLQALARDGVLPSSLGWLGHGSGPDDEPRNGTVVTLGIALGAVWMGSLDLIAPVLTMFFLTTYGVLNIAAGLERFLKSPSFRPRFKVHWSLSILGAVGCVSVMFLINAIATVVAGIVVLSIYLMLERSEMNAAWGDIRRGAWLALIRTGLLRLEMTPDIKNWRPHLLVLSGSPKRRWHLVDLADSLAHNRGLVTISTVLGPDVLPDRQRSLEDTLREYLLDKGISCLVKVVTAEDPFSGAEKLVAAYGIGPVTPNTVLVGDTLDSDHHKRFCEMISNIHESRRNLLIVHEGLEEESFGRRGRIDVWWGGLRSNGGLMLILAYLLMTSMNWRGARVVLKMVAPNEAAAEAARSNLEALTEKSRTGVEYEVIVADGRPFREIFNRASIDADLIFMGLREPDPDDSGFDVDEFERYYLGHRSLLEGMPTTILVLAAEDVDFGETFR